MLLCLAFVKMSQKRRLFELGDKMKAFACQKSNRFDTSTSELKSIERKTTNEKRRRLTFENIYDMRVPIFIS